MATFTISGNEYQSKLLDGETQLLIAKRLVSVLNVLASVATSLVEAFPQGRTIEVADLERTAGVLRPVTVELSKMDDADVKFIVDACLGVTSRRVAVGVGWVPVVQGGIVQDPSDGTFLSRISIAWFVLRENFSKISGLLGLNIDLTNPNG